ncbi:amidohydrolase [Dermatophilus congolensis]|uniref:amidohydrolase n=1 Tax=Dermatophilus congolensis TaxID=1863 RepID=UPI001E3974F8|nr:amidohydrolase [Dermatophilus congolensis]
MEPSMIDVSGLPVPSGPLGGVLRSIRARADEIVRFQRWLHRSPELSWCEVGTTRAVEERLPAGVSAHRFVDSTGLFVDVGAQVPDFRVGLRADMDALPLAERTGLPWASRVADVSHCCGHDVHTASLLGAVVGLSGVADVLRDAGVGVRCFFQPAEESHPSGARMVQGSGAADGVDVFYALHCDPATDLGRVGLRVGPITAAADRVEVRVSGAGGHTSRPHLTQDVTFALAKVVTELPALLTRVVDARASVVLVWGSVHAGDAGNVIPDSGVARGTLRVADAGVWQTLEPLVRRLVSQVVAPFGVEVDVEYVQGVPPVVNTLHGVEGARLAVSSAFGVDAAVDAVQSMGGEDFAWLLQGVEGALLRLGTRTPGGCTYDLHRGDLVVDPASAVFGAQLYAALPFAAAKVAGRGFVDV